MPGWIQTSTRKILDAVNGKPVSLAGVGGDTPNQKMAEAFLIGVVLGDWKPLLAMFKAQEEFGFLTFRLNPNGRAGTEQGTTHHIWAYLCIVGACLLIGPPEVKAAAKRWLSAFRGLYEAGRDSVTGECVMVGERVLERPKGKEKSKGYVPRTSEHLDEALRILNGQKLKWPKKYGWPADWADGLGVAALDHLYSGKPASARPCACEPKLLSPITVELWPGQGLHLKARFPRSSAVPAERAHSAGMNFRTGQKWWNSDPPEGMFAGEPEVRVIG